LSESEPTCLKDLRNLMMFFGRIPETHVKNLQSQPFIYFEEVKEVKLEYDLDTKSKNWFVKYNLILDKDPDHLTERSKGLEKAIKMLFWKEVVLDLSINGKEVYKSE
jgi:hypothetical protein